MSYTRPHCVNQMGKTHSKLLAARHGRGTAWARHAMCESALRVMENHIYMLEVIQRVDSLCVSRCVRLVLLKLAVPQ
jgi:hypothetical protein